MLDIGKSYTYIRNSFHSTENSSDFSDIGNSFDFPISDITFQYRKFILQYQKFNFLYRKFNFQYQKMGIICMECLPYSSHKNDPEVRQIHFHLPPVEQLFTSKFHCNNKITETGLFFP